MNLLTYFTGNQPKKVKWVGSSGQNLAKFGSTLWKNLETGISIGFFDILHEVNIYKHDVMVIEKPE